MPDKTYTHTFIVEGSGAFPVDMLRRDRCFPATEADANAIDLCRFDSLPRSIVLHRPEGGRWWMPNYGRWQSYGWRVVRASFVDHHGKRVVTTVVQGA